MNCDILYNKAFLTASYADSRSITSANPTLALAWLDTCIDSLRECSFFGQQFYFDSPHLLIRRLAKRLSDARYTLTSSATDLTKALGAFIRDDTILDQTGILPLLKLLVPRIALPYSQFTHTLVRNIETRFASGEYLVGLLSATKQAVASGAAMDHMRHLARATVAELLLLGYSKPASEELLLRCFDVPRGSAFDEWLFPDSTRPPSWSVEFDDRLDTLRDELFGTQREYIYIFPITGAKVDEEVILDGCRFYKPSKDSKFKASDFPSNPEDFFGAEEFPNAVNAEVRVEAHNVPQGHTLARRKLNSVIDRFQNLMPVHRSPVTVGERYLRTNDTYTSVRETILPHHFVHGVTIDKRQEENYKRFYKAFEDYGSRDFLQTLWSHAKSARDSRNTSEQFLSYWTILERICDEARIHLITPRLDRLTQTMAELLNAPYILGLPQTICQTVASRVVLATLPPYNGPMPVARMRLRCRDRENRLAFSSCNTVGNIVAALPGLAKATPSTEVSHLIAWASEFFQLGSSAAKTIATIRNRGENIFASLYEIRNEVIHDAEIDHLLLPSALEHVEQIADSWLVVLSSAMEQKQSANAAEAIASVYYEATVLPERLAAGAIKSLADWPIDVKDGHVHIERLPKFGPRGSIFGQF